MASSSPPSAEVESLPVPSQKKVIVVLCYRELGDSLIIPECPFCFCKHKHRVPNLQPLQTKNCNSDSILYTPGMATKVSDCQTPVHTYALELRNKEEVPIELKKLCRGTTLTGTSCKKRARPGSCVCLQHTFQMAGIAEKRWIELSTH